ncbi:MAG: hypothetical protein QOH06_1094 [Acidobacteriota bacterium]|nr:hypothetical protein [Acidobacteriota bacterium]
MLHRDVKTMHYELADRQVDDAARAHVLQKRLPLLQRSREIGVDAAFEELANGKIKIPVPREASFEVPLETLQKFQAALAEQDEDRIHQMLESSSELAAFVALPETVLLLVNTGSLVETQHILGQHPELLHPTADRVLTDLAQSQTNEAARRKVEKFRALLGRCRVIGVAHALASYTI